jgi:hypothetical protein
MVVSPPACCSTFSPSSSLAPVLPSSHLKIIVVCTGLSRRSCYLLPGRRREGASKSEIWKADKITHVTGVTAEWSQFAFPPTSGFFFCETHYNTKANKCVPLTKKYFGFMRHQSVKPEIWTLISWGAINWFSAWEGKITMCANCYSARAACAERVLGFFSYTMMSNQWFWVGCTPISIRPSPPTCPK